MKAMSSTWAANASIAIAHPGSALAILLERKRRSQQRTRIAEMGFDVVDPLARPLGEFGLGIEQIEAAGSSFHEQPDDAFGPGRKMARPRGERTLRSGCFAGQQPVLGQQIGQGQRSQPAADAAQKLAAVGIAGQPLRAAARIGPAEWIAHRFSHPIIGQSM